MKTLVIDHQTNTYTITNNGASHSAPIKHRRVVSHVAGIFKHIGYSVQIIHRKGNTPMALTPAQQATVDRNHWRALHAIKNGAKKINGVTLKAMVNRDFCTYNLEIKPAGDRFYASYQPLPEDLELKDMSAAIEVEPEETEIEPTIEPAPASSEIETAITPAPEAAPVSQNSVPTVIQQPDQPAATDDEARETILELRKVVLYLGKALAPGLEPLFNAIEHSDNYLFGK